ncbi:alpha/beta hydrolase family protein [Streptomyces sp. NPDC048248]|uniref:alpha/beta hydrolase family protein n=1 Tax=Streptomyces sp. NPDC048248 TaxID=3365523 RepID=UPI0037212D47
MSTARRKGRQWTTVTALAALLATGLPATALADGVGGQSRHLTGTLASGADYVIDVPAHWNGTVLLFSHGYRPAGMDNPAADAPDDATRALLLGRGYALAGSSYATTGWAGEQAVPDQLNTLDAFARRVGRARTTLAWGESYGGLVTTALAERHSDRLDGSLSVCGLVHGGVANWNNTLDPVHALKTLLAPGSGTPLVGFRNQREARNASAALSAVVQRAQGGEQGRARIALAAALHNIPSWNDPDLPRPEPGDPADAERAQYPVIQSLIAGPAFSWRQEAESRAGGNMSWNTGVDYSQMLRHSVNYQQVKDLYKTAGLSLQGDLRALAKAPRIRADHEAVAYIERNLTLSGRLRTPQLNIHTTGDPLVPVQTESAYRHAADRTGSSRLLRQAYVDNAGHCTFSPGELAAAVKALDHRVHTGHWGDTSPHALNASARTADPASPARYLPYVPARYPRPYYPARTPGDGSDGWPGSENRTQPRHSEGSPPRRAPSTAAVR